MISEVAMEMHRTRWKRYPVYRDSGVEWIGEVPEGWEINKLSRIAEIKGRIGWRGYTVSDLRDKDDGVLVIGATQIDVNGNIDLSKPTYLSHEKYEESPEIKLKGFELLLVKVGATIGKVGYVPYNFEKATINPNVMIVRNSNLSQKFLFYFLRSPYVQIEMEVSKSAGAQDAINQDFVGSLMIVSPSSPEQCAIADFLDRETGRIDTLIEKKERQVELLQEKRAALISHTVTKGLDPDVKMKDSGVEWIGEVPEHWNIERLKYCAKLINEKVDGRESILPYTGLENIESWTGRLISQEEISTSEGQSNRFEIGDVLFGKLRPYLAKVLRAKENGICTGELLVLRPKNVSQDFLFRYMLARNFISIVDSSTYGAKMPRASWDFIGDLPVLFPTEAEQRAIATFLDRETERIDTLTIKICESISKLREYRTALISAAVTGKIDVRGFS